MADSELFLKRLIFTDISTIGDLFWLGNIFECNTLEPTCRDPNKDGVLEKEEKVWGKTAIPAGRYEIKLEWSNHYQRKMPHLQSVPYFDHVMIHWGNWAKDTLGCILVGEKLPGSHDYVSASQKTYNELEAKILEALEAGKLFINIEGGPRT